MSFNKDELIIDRVRSATYADLETQELLLRLTSIEDPSLNCTSESEEVTDAIGSTVSTLYRAKKGQFTGSNSLFNFGLAAAQYGATKEIASNVDKFKMPTYEILTIQNGKVQLSHAPADANEVKYIYSLVGGEIATAYTAGVAVGETTFTITDGGEISVPTGLTGKVYVEYSYETSEAMKVVNKADQFPKSGILKVFAYFRDKCNDGLVYSGAIIAPKAKINAESVEIALTSTGKHPFQFDMNKDYCDEEGELFSVIIANGGGAGAADEPHINFNKSNVTLAPEGTYDLIVDKYPANATPTYTTTDAEVATVSDAGKITAVAAGNAVIVGTIVSGGKSYTAICNVTVTGD